VEWNFQVLLPLMFSRCQRLCPPPNACPGLWWRQMKTTLMALLALGLCVVGCGKKAPEQQANQPTEATLTPGMEAAKKAHDEGRYQEAVRLYTAELAPEEAKSAPSWVQLSHLNNELGLALDNAGQYDKAQE